MTTIGIITGNLQKNRTGMATYAYQVMEGLRNQYSLTQVMHPTGDPLGQCQIITPTTFPGPFNYLPWSISLSLQRKIFADFDIIHNICQYPIILPPAKKTIVTVYDLIPVLYPSLVTPVYAWQSRTLLPRILKRTTRVLTISHHTKKDLIEKFHIPSDKIDVTHLGVSDHFKPSNQASIDTFRQKNNLNHPYILFVGALEPKKNIQFIIHAFSHIHKELPDMQLILAGKKSWKYQSIFDLIHQLNLTDSVQYLDFVPYDDLPHLYSGAVVFVFPSWYEGFGLPPLEAMKCGTPVIVSNRSSLPEIVGDQGLMVNPENIHELYNMIMKVISDPDFRREMSLYYLKHAEIFTWERCIIETRRSYEKALSE